MDKIPLYPFAYSSIKDKKIEELTKLISDIDSLLDDRFLLIKKEIENRMEIIKNL